MTADLGRNDPCLCGSGLKYKKCCLTKPDNPFAKKLGRGYHWSHDEINQMPTEAIIGQLETWGVHFNTDQFLQEVATSYGAYDIYERWKKDFTITAEGFDTDFPWMACEVLWDRLVPNKVSTEQLDDWMQNGYDCIQNREKVVGCNLWLKVWDELKTRFTPAMTTIEAAEQVFRGSQLLFNWCQDLEEELLNAARDDKTFHDHRIRYCGEFLQLFPESDTLLRNNMRMAIGESLFGLDRKEEGDQVFQSLVTDEPDNPWGYIGWGDMYAGSDGGCGIKDVQRAEELYQKALGLDKKEDNVVRERLKNLKDLK
jgi:hypothetical protein